MEQNPKQNGPGAEGTAIRGKIDDLLYDVITILHEKSKGLDAYDKYEKDVQGNSEVKQLFDEIRRQDEEAVQKLRDCLAGLLAESGSERRAA